MPETVACYALPARDYFHSFPKYSTVVYDHNTIPMDQISGHRWQKAEIKLDLGGLGEQIKHRRTRSGCFTCRARRVKCDEARPICERCAKGGRQCTFPDAAAAPKAPRARRKQSSHGTGSTNTQEKSPSPDDQESDTCFSDVHSIDLRYLSAYPLDSPNPTLSAAGSARSQRSLSPIAMPYSGETYTESRYPLYLHDNRSDSMLGSLPLDEAFTEATTTASAEQTDVDFWLRYHEQNITFRQYLLKSDTSGFFTRTLLSYAAQNDALLYSVIAFSAYHFFVNENTTEGHRDGDKSSSAELFFEYHNRAIVALRESFQENLPPDVFTLLTILQLATLEEYLGDWANLIEHRKGAFMILESLFSPQSILDTQEGYPIFSWFARIDLSVSMMTGSQTILDPDWYDAANKSCEAQLAQQSDNLYWIILTAESHCRQITMRLVNILYARFNGFCDYQSYENTIVGTLKDITAFWEQFSDLTEALDFERRSSSASLQAEIGYVYAEIHALGMLIHHQRSVVYGFDKDYMSAHCTAICEIVEAATARDKAAHGSLLPFQLSLAMAAAFNPDDNLKPVFLEQLHLMEQIGFIYPIPFRTLLSKLWNDPSIRLEWLSFPDQTKSQASVNILSAIRALAEDRNEEMNFSYNHQSTQLMRNLFSFADLQA
ncbi:hypothetical protein H072_1109 [Dactylellina haptotyla CBS 200.50]|uniref:Zn(2)-C6 fungal-type domain-containing protein n=1 Tax=Dactylellina haptotyla (strain CBS 200.50) TaxID=1284197 RepID=S8APM6_DACHA|nr:hypothetical protein H072_1109 [Dactylellina haptotyla CBS 200.50]